MLEIKAVFFDIDGTLLTDSRTVLPSTVSAINQLKKQGILVGLATGRDPRFVLQYMASLSLDVAITYNGQYILSRENVLFMQELPKEDMPGLMEYARAHKKDLSFGTAFGVAGSRIMSFGGGNLAYRLTRLIPPSWAGLVNFIFNRFIRKVSPQNEEQLQIISERSIYQMMLLATEKETKQLVLQFPRLDFTRSSPYAVDIVSKGNSKLEGIKCVGEHYQFCLDEVVVFGDSNNDLEMLAEIPYSVAMKNGTRKARQTAFYVTDTNNRDGIFKALEHFGLVEGRTNVS